jgi:hypothetical protein
MRPVGIALSFIGSTCDSVGTLFQKQAQAESTRSAESENREEGELDYVGTWKWRLGFGLYTTGSILAFVAIGMVGPNLIVVVAAFALVVNLLLSPAMLEENREWSDWVAVFFIIVGIGSAISALETNEKVDTVSVKAMAGMVTSEKAWSVWTSLVGTILLLTWGCQIPKGKSKPLDTIQHTFFVARPAVSGTLSLMLAAPTSALFQDPTNGPSWMWAFPVFMITSTILDVHFVNKSLKHNEALFHAPVCFCVWQILSLFCGAIMYEETKGFQRLQWILGGVGVGLTLVGVGVSSLRPLPGSPRYRRLEYL